MKMKKPESSIIESSGNYAKIRISPLERGFGTTLGNCMRKTLLSMLPGAAVSSVVIEGVSGGNADVPGVRESAGEILLNLKRLAISLLGADDAVMFVNEIGPKDVKASDISCDPDVVHIADDGMHIATIEDGGRLSMRLNVTTGIGYTESERIGLPSPDALALDCVYTPVIKAVFDVQPVRVGSSVDHDCLVLEVWTDGSVSPQQAVRDAAEIAKSRLDPFVLLFARGSESFLEEDIKDEDIPKDFPVEELELGNRAMNCLRRANIQTAYELADHSALELAKIRNLGASTLREIERELEKRGLALKRGV